MPVWWICAAMSCWYVCYSSNLHCCDRSGPGDVHSTGMHGRGRPCSQVLGTQQPRTQKRIPALCLLPYCCHLFLALGRRGLGERKGVLSKARKAVIQILKAFLQRAASGGHCAELMMLGGENTPNELLTPFIDEKSEAPGA